MTPSLSQIAPPLVPHTHHVNLTTVPQTQTLKTRHSTLKHVIDVEQAGGLSLTGKTRIMDLIPQKVNPAPSSPYTRTPATSILNPSGCKLHPEPFRVEVSNPSGWGFQTWTQIPNPTT